MSNSKKISYVLIIRRIFVTTTVILFGILAVRVTFDIGKSSYLLYETFDLELLKKRGPLISKPFRVSKSPRFYNLSFERALSSHRFNLQLSVNVKLVNNKNQVINNFDVDFSKDPKKSYNKKYRTKYFKSNKNEQLYVVMKLLKNNVKASKSKSSYSRNRIKVSVDSADDDIPTKFYYRVFIYCFFIMIVMLFIPKKMF
ncbi:hypothetical protein BKI52_36320 [marine bacterium AO1-C]|nr:hypothetical protein BKI52_36320 [marine bacterium AO1-C]